MAKKKEKNKVEKKKQGTKVLKGKCLRCGKPMFKNHKSCCTCNRKDRLRSKANKRGKKKSYYLNGDGK